VIGDALGTNTEPPELEVVSAPAAASEAVNRLKATGIVPTDGVSEIRNVQFTRTPSGITRTSNPPTSTVFPEKFRDFPAPAAPSATDCRVISDETNVQTTSVQRSPAVDAMVTGSVTVPPGIPAPDPIERVIMG
jgi:hypothetical protein